MEERGNEGKRSKTQVFSLNKSNGLDLVQSTIDRCNFMRWNFIDHAKFLKDNAIQHEDGNAGDTTFIFIDEDIIASTDDNTREEIIKTLDKNGSVVADVVLLNYNRISPTFWNGVFSKYLQKSKMYVEDIACYSMTMEGCRKILAYAEENLEYEGNVVSPELQLSIDKLFIPLPQLDNWETEKYLDTESPILVCHLLRKWRGSAAGVLARPLGNIYGFKYNVVYVMLLSLSLFCGLLGLPSEWVMRMMYLFQIFEPLEGLTLKVVLVLLVCKLAHVVGKNPLFFI